MTLCTFRRVCLFGEVVGGDRHVSSLGLLVEAEWLRTAQLRSGVELDAFVVMPNHFHGIIVLSGKNGSDSGDTMVGATRRVALAADNATRDARPLQGARSGSLGAIISQIKSMTTKRAATVDPLALGTLWQRSYDEHIIRNEASLARLRDYILANPARWAKDQLHPDNPSRW